MFNRYSNSYFSDSGYRPGDFVLSGVNKENLNKYGIAMTVKEFKDLVGRSGKYKTVMTGGSAAGYRHTQVYNYNDFRN